MEIRKSIVRQSLGACWIRAGLSVGILWGMGLFLTGAIATYTSSWGQTFIDAIGSIYWGYSATWGGAFLGLLWGFLDGFIGTGIAVGLYHALRLTSRKGGCCVIHDMASSSMTAEGETGYESTASGGSREQRPAEVPGAAGAARAGAPATGRQTAGPSRS